MSEKPCTLCGVVLPATAEFFFRQPSGKFGVTSRCKACCAKLSRQYRDKHKDEISAYTKEWRKNNRESAQRASAAWRARNPDEAREQVKTWRKNNPEMARAQVRRRRAVILNCAHEAYTEQQVLDKYGTDCYLCNDPIDLGVSGRTGSPGWERGLHIEHVISLARGGSDTLDNVRPAHGKCNLKKSSK